MNPSPTAIHGTVSLATLTLTVAVVGCATGQISRPDARSAWQEWQKERHQSIAGTNGWSTLVGLHWLAEGQHRIGPEPEATVPLPSPRALGELRRTGREVWFHPASGSDVLAEGVPVREPLRLIPDVPGPANQLSWGTHRFWLLERGDRLGVRVRDVSATARREFRGLTYFPWQSEWQLQAHFEPHPPGRTLAISDVTGATKLEPNPGVIVFQYAGHEYRLEALADTDAGDLFVLFQDATNGSTTYAPGRFLHTPYPDASGRVLLDFNRAYNPPCAFTDFATCPRPPTGNRLPFAVTGGEKLYQR